jgi:DNA-directed RNA polymerase subunit RPC12/RpoP
MTKKTVFYGRVEERKVEIDDINTHQQIYLWDSDTAWKVGDVVRDATKKAARKAIGWVVFTTVYRCPGCRKGIVDIDDSWLLTRVKCDHCGRVWGIMHVPHFIKERLDMFEGSGVIE